MTIEELLEGGNQGVLSTPLFIIISFKACGSKYLIFSWKSSQWNLIMIKLNKLNSNYLEFTKHKNLNAPEWGLVKGPEISDLFCGKGILQKKSL